MFQEKERVQSSEEMDYDLLLLSCLSLGFDFKDLFVIRL